MDHSGQRLGRHAAEAYRAIQHLVLDGGLPPGERISHRTLAANVGVGRGAMRDAILRLEAEGLLEQRQKSGVSLRGIDAAAIADVYRLRAVVEPLFAERAAIRSDAQQAAALEALCDEMEAMTPTIAPGGVLDETAWRRLVQLDMQFHAAVIEAAGPWLLTQFYHHEHALARLGAWYGQHPWLSLEREEATNREHRDIATAIRRQDPDAAAVAARRHNEGQWLDVVLQRVAR